MSDPTNPQIVHSISLAEHNFIVKTLNRNPLGGEVMDVAALIGRLNSTAQKAVDVAAAKLAAAVKAADGPGPVAADSEGGEL